MKKLLLVFFSVLSFSMASAQINQPFSMSICDGGNVFFGDQTNVILGNLNPDDYTVTYHQSQTNAEVGINALPDPSVFTASQTVYVRVTENANPANFETTSFTITVNASPLASDATYTVCDLDGNNDGMTSFNLEFAIQQLVVGQANVSVAFYATQMDAMAQVNQLPWMYSNMTNPETIYYTITDWFSGCMSIGTVSIVVVADCSAICPSPGQVIATNITNTSLVLGWTEMGTANQWEVIALPAGSPAPTVNTTGGIYTTSNPFVFTNLTCGAGYDLYVRSLCIADGGTGWTPWSSPTFVDMPCMPIPGQPINLEACSDTTQACFNLTQNDANILGTLDPLNFTVTYYTSYADAQNGVNPITAASAYCVTQPGPMSLEVYARLEQNNNGYFELFAFGLTVRQVTASNFTPLPLYECDSDANGSVVFDLTEVASQINTSNPLSYYDDSNAATSASGAGALASPQAFEMAVSSGTITTTIFVRENITGACDIVYSLQIMASSNCNLANVCSNANSLCSSLGTPFTNTVNNGSAQAGIDYDCLFTQPNPTWFFLPISEAGDLSFHMEQQNFAGGGLDVDFICWGPFDSPVTPCSGPAYLNASTQIGCSYSAAATESFTIVNAQPGQFYLLMITNFSDQPGLITVTQTNAGQPDTGEIDCSGIRLTAFVDENGNGTKEASENTFALGQFHYERNNDGVTHNLTSLSGITHIYDINPANVYDVNYTVDPMYVPYYSVSPSSYSNISVPAGGLAEYFFPVTLTQSYDDLVVALIPNSPPMPGFTYTNTIRYTNLGSQTVAAGTITFLKPSAVSIVSVSEAGATLNANGFVYNFNNLLQGETRDIVVTMQVPVIPTVELGQVLTATVDIVPLAADIAPQNNSAWSTQVVVGSWDPNDKSESRGKYVLFSDFGADDYLYYTIRFENEGTAAAQTVKINDVLESQLDETSVRMVAASHDYVLDRTGSVLNWTFDNIQLPYASANPEGAKGFVQFMVKPKPGFAIGDIIQNTASIYFDYNPAIVTNSFETHFVTSLGNPVVGTSEFTMYPNPAGDRVTVSLSGVSDTIASIAVYDMVGKKVLVKTSVANIETVDVSQLGSGMYFVEVMTSAQTRTTQKLIVR